MSYSRVRGRGATGASWFFLACVFLLPGPQEPLAQEMDSMLTPGQLKKMSLEELMDIKVTLVSKHSEKLNQSPSAVQVITSDDIRRAGASTLPEALRLASNLQVAQINGSQWAISARGMNMALSNKLLVMVDGRTVYTPLYAGVFWDVQNILMDNVERIEVVSGPGGTLWGANAVNGVINIITKSAENTQGGLVAAGGGLNLNDPGEAATSGLRDLVTARYGGKLGPKTHYRVWGRRLDYGSMDTLGGGDGHSAWEFNQAGFRIDHKAGARDRVSLTGNLFNGDYQTEDTYVNGQYLVARWTREISEASDFYFQSYFDREDRTVPNVYGEKLNIFDFDFHHRIPWGGRQSIIYGAGYRVMLDEVSQSQVLAILPEEKTLQLFNGFIQDQFTLVPNLLTAIAGSKLERNDYSGWEVMPSLRLSLTPDERQTLWTAVSRAVRSPSRVDVDFFLPAPPVPAGNLRLLGGPGFKAELLTAFELGYRVNPMRNLTLSIASFYNYYDDLRILQRVPGTLTDFVYANGAQGGVAGVELWAGWQAAEWCQLRGGYTWLDEEYWVKSGHLEIPIPAAQGNDPSHQGMMQANLDLPRGFELNGAARAVSELPEFGVPGYFTFDLGVVWRYHGLTVSVMGKDLAEERHQEFANPPNLQAIPRSVTGRIAWRF
jgi:iron complex outermembrane receptor protein